MAVMPISLSNLNESTMTLNKNPYDINEYHKNLTNYRINKNVTNGWNSWGQRFIAYRSLKKLSFTNN